MKITLSKPWKYAHRGHTVIEYDTGEHEVSDECAAAAKEAGVIKVTRPAKKKPTKVSQNKAK